jgi:hypothetical protein
VSRFLSYVRKHHVALLALFVAMGGTSYAALKLPSNSVGSKQIKANAVNSSKVANRSLLAGDFKAGQLPAGPQGLKGDQGIQGIQGIQGDKGPLGPTTAASAGGSNPPANPSDPTSWVTTNITTPTAGSVLVLGAATAGQGCTASGGCTTTWGVYFDGAPVPNTAHSISAGPSATRFEDLTFQGVMPNIAAGDHTLTIQVDASANDFSRQMQARTLTGIALGR